MSTNHHEDIVNFVMCLNHNFVKISEFKLGTLVKKMEKDKAVPAGGRQKLFKNEGKDQDVSS